MINNQYISFVVTARNDNYGGNFLHRMQIFMSSLLTLCERESLNTELVIVEWNPPPNTPKLAEVLTIPKNLKFVGVHFIEVPNEIHKKLPNSEKMPMFEYIAQNVGIRRAKGEYILATNPDIIFSAELVSFLASRELSPKCFYRIDRHDIEEPVPLGKPVEEQLGFCAKYWVKVCTIKGNMKRACRFLDYKSLRALVGWLRNSLISRSTAGVHLNASGDFLLMHRDHWHKLHGYPELPTHSHIDAYMCFIAASSGLLQIILGGKKRIYHQGHTRPTGTRPWTDLHLLLQQGKQMMELGQPLIMNDGKWGLADKNLPSKRL
ncbi:unnamed protein product [marine sediment metagenome]|uniref:Glycosyltransferase 2-like domain-containing protein n=1 Tax=marine sediment metagenome TaxID=412755 RepID=X1ACX5_9ZZZZ